MAAGDVTVLGDSGRAMRGVRMVWGTVQLDGANPTPVALAAYGKAVIAASLQHRTSSTPGDDPTVFTHDISGSTLNVYAWKNTSGTDPTLVASTNNTGVVDFVALMTA